MILIVDMSPWKDSLWMNEFVQPIASIITEDCEAVHYTDVSDIGKYSRIILSGGPLKDMGYLDTPDRFGWIAKCGKPVLGICAGMQAICAAFGSKAVNCEEIGMTRIETVRKNLLFQGSFEAYELHRHAMKPSSDFAVLARSEACVQAVKHMRKPIYGVLFHPEVRNREIIENFVRTG
jgi:GMP synthase-like glutamine amidotransferase